MPWETELTRVLVLSTLFPNAAQPNHGIFVENRLRHTLALGGLEATVVAPTPFFPFSHPAFGRYAVFAKAPRHEVRHGVEVWHPRYAVIPKFGSAWTPQFLYRAALSAVRRLQRQGRSFDVIDAHYFYPDGVAAAMLGRTLRLPVVITGRGTDLTLIPQARGPRAQIQRAAGEASAMIAVCDDLRTRLVALGADEARTLVLRNGVDLDQFAMGDRQGARQALNLQGFTLLSVGSLIPRKGHGLIIEALAGCPDCTLLIAGQGPLRAELEAQARRFGVEGRVRFLGEVSHAELPSIYRAADVMVLASQREGWANVLLEAMACGTPVLASDVNGTAEVVRSPAAGRLLPERTPRSLIDTLAVLRRDMPRREDTRKYAERFDWLQIAQANKTLLTAVARAGYDDRRSDAAVREARRQLGDSVEQTLA
jgi:glycosyltransferase involved in cell wall biosynthesis